QRANGSNKFDNHFNSLQSYALMLNEYVLIKSALIKLAGEYALQKEPDLETIELLKQKGYKIDLKKYQESLEAGFKKAENLVTKVISKKNEIEARAEKGGGSATFDELMANLTVNNIQVSDDLKLARYNEIVKILKKRSEKTRKHGRTRT